MRPALTYQEFRNMGVCSPGLRRGITLLGGIEKLDDRKIDAKEARKIGVTLEELIYTVCCMTQKNPEVKDLIYSWVSECVPHGAVLVENKAPVMFPEVMALAWEVRDKIMQAQKLAKDSRAEEERQYDRLVEIFTGDKK